MKSQETQHKAELRPTADIPHLQGLKLSLRSKAQGVSVVLHLWKAGGSAVTAVADQILVGLPQ